jgi:hypothetical protein
MRVVAKVEGGKKLVIGSDTPAPFSTVIINTSLPGISGRSFDMSGVISAASVIDAVIKASNANTSFLLCETSLALAILTSV